MAVSVSGSKLHALGVNNLFFGPPSNTTLSEEQLTTLRESCSVLSELFDDNSLDKSQFETVKKNLAEAGIEQLIVGVAEELDAENLQKVQSLAIELFNELDLSISPYN